MKNKIKIIIVIFVLALAAITVYGKATEEKYQESQEEVGFLANLNELGEISAVMDMILRQHVSTNLEKTEPITKQNLLDGALKGMLNELNDPYSVYFTKSEMSEFNEDMSGKFAGVGMQINKKTDEYLNVVSPIEGTPAFEAGIKPNDKIIEIDGQNTVGLTTMDCTKILRGEPGTDVKLKIYRESTKNTFEVTLTRDIIELKYVKYSMLDDKIGVVRLTQFVQGVSKDVQKAVEDLLSQGMEALIFDLRFNPGGALDESIKVASLFVKEGVIVSVRGRDEETIEYKREGKFLGDFPMAVLVNSGSASASEIVSGALKDYKRAILVGEKTFGKGSVQNVIPLHNGGGAKLTIAKYYTPNNISIDKTGLEPDIVVVDEDDYLFFDGYITNIDEEAKEENKEELINMIGEVEGEEKKEELKHKEDKQKITAENILKGILMFNN
jgi:carboxyl-terminal processing protease